MPEGQAVAAPDMTPEQFEDFVNEMYWLAHEEGYLWEAPLGAIDKLPSGDVVHGPWRQEDCAAVLSAWHAAGLLGLYKPAPDGPEDLTDEEVTRVLTSTGPWTHGWASFAVYATEGESADDLEHWRALVSR